MSKSDSRSAATAARRAKIPSLWNAGLTGRQIAARLDVSLLTALADIAALQAGRHIEKRMEPRKQGYRVTHGPGRPRTKAVPDKVRAADRQRAASAHAEEVAGFARAKRVVTISRACGELRVVKFFADCREAEEADRLSITGVGPGIVTGDAVFMGSGGGASQSWSLWREMGARAA